MGDRSYTQFQYSLEKGRVTLHAHAAIGATGAVTLQSWNPVTRAYATAGTNGWGGIKSITRTGVGLYTIVLQNTYQRLLNVNAMFSLTGGTSNIVQTQVNSTLTTVTTASAPAVAICTMSSTATAADPDNGCTMDLEIVLQNSSAL